jgi:AbrB family looped-hinge helix DNA binding protein
MRITSKGQVTIPQEIRNQLNLLPRTSVEFKVVNGHVEIHKAKTGAKYGPRGQAAIEALERASVSFGKWTTDEIMAMTRDYPLPRKKRQNAVA